MQIISEYSFAVVGILGALAFMVSLITELIKKMPTKAFVILVSLVVTVAALLIYAAYVNAVLLWYYVALAVFAAFIVAYIAMYGWDTLKELKDKFIK